MHIGVPIIISLQLIDPNEASVWASNMLPLPEVKKLPYMVFDMFARCFIASEYRLYFKFDFETLVFIAFS